MSYRILGRYGFVFITTPLPSISLEGVSIDIVRSLYPTSFAYSDESTYRKRIESLGIRRLEGALNAFRMH
jgi:hypothetical protein